MQRTQKRSSATPSRSRPGATSRGSQNSRAPGSRPSSKGARVSQIRWRDRWQGYWAHHLTSARDSLQRLLAAPVQSLMTWLVMAVALALPATLYTSFDNLQALGQRWDGSPRITIFLNPQARDKAIADFQRQLQGRAGIKSLQFVSAEQALQEFERDSGMGSALRSLDSNPLPPSLVLTPQLDMSAAQLAQLGQELREQPLVDDLVFDQAWIERLQHMLKLGERLVLALGGLLALGVLLVIGNTIRLAIESRRDEIVVIKLVGGTDAFVRRPFLYTGFWYGLGGGLLALLLLSLLLWLLTAPVSSLAVSYQSDFKLQGLGAGGAVVLVGLGALIGWLGAWLAVGRHLGDIEPR